MSHNYDVMVLLPTHNCLDLIDRSIGSVFEQSFPAERLRLVAFDNASTDGTYERLVEYARDTEISVQRMRKKVFQTRLLHAAFNLLDHLDFRYITVLRPGDVLHRDFIQSCAEAMDRHGSGGRKMLLCEANVIGPNGVVSPRTPVYSRSCTLLRTEHYTQFFLNGSGHKIQPFYCKRAAMTPLSILAIIEDHTDWFKHAILSFQLECIYLKSPLADIRTSEYPDLLRDLMVRFYLVKRMELNEQMAFDNREYRCLDEPIYRNLSFFALQYAIKAIGRKQLKTAAKILLFAEMVFEPITSTALYSTLKSSIESGRPLDEEQLAGMEETSVSPPEGATLLPEYWNEERTFSLAPR